MPVDVEGEGQQLGHDAVVSDQGGQTPVNLEEALNRKLSGEQVLCLTLSSPHTIHRETQLKTQKTKT